MDIAPQITEAHVKNYLNQNPQFFENHPDLLAIMFLPSPHGNGTVSLAERQQLAQREKIRAIEQKFSELLRNAQENDLISQKIHQLCLSLIGCESFDEKINKIIFSLSDDFQIPYTGIRIWTDAMNSEHMNHDVFKTVDIELKNWAESLIEPYCGNKPGLDFNSWFGENSIPKSFALITLRTDKTFGLLAMASDQDHRFYPEMGTLYLKRIGELISASLSKYILL